MPWSERLAKDPKDWLTGVYKVPYSSCEEEKGILCGEEYNVEKRERGSNIIFLIILKLLGRISREAGEKGTEI